MVYDNSTKEIPKEIKFLLVNYHKKKETKIFLINDVCFNSIASAPVAYMRQNEKGINLNTGTETQMTKHQ